MSRFDEEQWDRREFLAVGMAAVPTFLPAKTTNAGSVAGGQRFFTSDGRMDLGFHPIPPGRFLILDIADDVTSLACRITDFYGVPGYESMMKSRLELAPHSSCRAGYSVIKNRPLLRDWWLFGSRTESGIRPIVMHFTSSESLEECSITGSLVARITTHLHRQRKRFRGVSSSLPQYLRLVNWEIIQAAKSLLE